MDSDQFHALLDEIKMINRNILVTSNFVQIGIVAAFIIVAIKW